MGTSDLMRMFWGGKWGRFDLGPFWLRTFWLATKIASVNINHGKMEYNMYSSGAHLCRYDNIGIMSIW